jgi:hypothetical protein
VNIKLSGEKGEFNSLFIIMLIFYCFIIISFIKATKLFYFSQNYKTDCILYDAKDPEEIETELDTSLSGLW